MTELALATIAHNEPRLIAEQIRLLDKYLEEDWSLLVCDSSTDPAASAELLSVLMGQEDQSRLRLSPHCPNDHAGALNAAAHHVVAGDCRYIGFLDHDVFPTRPTRLVPLIEEAGFYGVGQRVSATGKLYLWPGFCFFSRAWLAGRPLDFCGVRGKHPRDDGDTGSAMWPLFADEDWSKLYRAPHGYEAIREPDDFGLQSWGVERIGDWVHFSNGSKWMQVPNPEERERLLFEMLAKL